MNEICMIHIIEIETTQILLQIKLLSNITRIELIQKNIDKITSKKRIYKTTTQTKLYLDDYVLSAVPVAIALEIRNSNYTYRT